MLGLPGLQGKLQPLFTENSSFLLLSHIEVLWMRPFKTNAYNGLPHPRSSQSPVSGSCSDKPKGTTPIWAANPDPRHLGASSPPANETYKPVNNSLSCSCKQLAVMSSLEPQGLLDQKGRRRGRGTSGALQLSLHSLKRQRGQRHKLQGV